MPRANAPGGSGPRRVKRRPTTAGRSLVPPKQAARADRYSRRVVRSGAVRQYKGEGPSKMSPRREAIALRTMMRNKATPSEWKALQRVSPTGYALPGLEKNVEQIRTLRSAATKKDDGGNVFSDAAKAISGFVDALPNASPSTDLTTKDSFLYDELAKVKITLPAPPPAVDIPQALGQKPSKPIKTDLAQLAQEGAIDVVTGAAIGGAGKLAIKATKAGAKRYGPGLARIVDRVVGEVGDPAAKGISKSAAEGSGIKGAASRTGKSLSEKVKPITSSRAGQGVKAGVQKIKEAKAAAGQKAGETSAKIVDATPKPARTAAKVASAPVRHVGRNKLTYGGLAAAPSAVQAVKGGNVGDITGAPITAVEGMAQGFSQNKGQTLSNTAAMIPGFITAAGGYVANLGLSTKRAVDTTLPGGDSYSAGEIISPTWNFAKRNVEETLKMLEIYGSGNKQRIADATSRKGGYGLSPAIAVLPPVVKGLSGPARTLVRDPLRVKAAERRAAGKPRMFAVKNRSREPGPYEPDRPIFEANYKHGQRFDTSRKAAQRTGMTTQEQRTRTRAIVVPARKANRAIPGKKLRVARVDGKEETIVIKPADTLGLAQEFGIPRNAASAQAKLTTLIDKLTAIKEGRVKASEADPMLRMPRPEMITTLEAATYMLENLPAILKNNSYWRAKRAFANYISDQAYSRRAPLMGVAFLEDILRPEDRTPAALQDVPGVPAERAKANEMFAGVMVDKNGKRVKRLGSEEKRLSEARKEIKRLQRDISNNRNVQKLNRELATLKRSRTKAKSAKKIAEIDQKIALKREVIAAEKEQLATARASLNELRVNAKKLKERNQQIKQELRTVDRAPGKYTDAELKQFEQDVQAVIRDKGYDQPGWRAQVDATRPNVIFGKRQPSAGGQGSNIPDLARTRGDKMRDGVLLDGGRIAENFEVQIHNSILNPVAKRNIFGLWRDVLLQERPRYTFSGRHQFTMDEWNALIDRGLVDPNDLALVPVQQTKRLWEDPARKSDANVEATMGELGNYSFPDLSTSQKRLDAKNQSDVQLSDVPPEGRLYEGMRSETFKELMAQSQKQENAWLDAAQRINSDVNRVLLGTSPMWAAIQVVAESLQGASVISTTGIPTPVSLYKLYRSKMLKEWQQLPDKQKWGLASMAGESLGTKPNLSDVRNSLAFGEIDSAAYAMDGLMASPIGRSMKSVATLRALGEFDQLKGGVIRRGVAAHVIDKELNGFLSNYRKAFLGSKKLYDDMRGMSRAEQLAYLEKNPAAAARVMRYLEDTMGEWRAISSRERLPASFLAFYPFLRMSLRVFFRGLPARHPFKTSMLYTLGTVNAQVLQDFLHGDPAYFAEWASVPLFGGEDGEVTSTLNLARAAPAANALIESIGDSSALPGSLVRLGSPALGPIVAFATGQTAFGQLDTANLPVADRIRVQGLAAIMQLLSLAAPIRLLDQSNLGVQNPRRLPDNRGGTGDAIGDFISNSPGLGDLARFMNKGEDSELSALTRKLGPQGAALVARNLIPLIPTGRKEARMKSQIGDLMDRIAKKPDVRSQMITIINAAQLARKGNRVPAQRLRRARIDAQNAQYALDKLFKRYDVSRDIRESVWDQINLILGEITVPTSEETDRRKKVKQNRSSGKGGDSSSLVILP